MTVSDVFSKAEKIVVPEGAAPVFQTIAEEIQITIQKSLPIENRPPESAPRAGEIVLTLSASQTRPNGSLFFQAGSDFILLKASWTSLLYALWRKIREELWAEETGPFTKGKSWSVPFRWVRAEYDLLITQTSRTVAGVDREAYFREMARLGYTHAEVNALAGPVPAETGVPGENYPRFYTYCAGLDQFVESRWSKGTYEQDYLDANLKTLKKYAALAVKYGLHPGILSFEPRTVPETLLERYPMIRGPRVDHPFRSFKPRYTLSTAHPLVRAHYAELIQNLMKAVPELSYMTIWTNDSGAGMEHTNSLYVGRNGGAFLIREWRTHEDIARAAGENAVRYLKTLRDAAAKINPEFRVILRIDPLSAEKDTIVEKLEPGLELESATFLMENWEQPYPHVSYEDVKGIGETPYLVDFWPKEKEKIEQFRSKGSDGQIVVALGHANTFEPLLGIPFPWLMAQKLRNLAKGTVRKLASRGGIVPTSLVPWNINQELLRKMQLGDERDTDEIVAEIAQKWAGRWSGVLTDTWRETDSAIRFFPIPVALYAVWGFPWYRFFVRPFVPNIEAIPEKEREYYEKFSLVTAHNPSRVDFAQDVLFKLCDQPTAVRAVERMKRNLFPPLTQAKNRLQQALEEMASDDPARPLFVDQRDRLRALFIWFRTHKNIAAWIAGVHGYLETEDSVQKAHWKQVTREMVLDEMENARDLLDLWENSTTRFMAISGVGETTFIYGDNLGDLIRRKLDLMAGHEDDEPYIDPNFMWRIPGVDFSDYKAFL